MSSSQRWWWGDPKSDGWCPYKKEEMDPETQGREPGEDRSREWRRVCSYEPKMLRPPEAEVARRILH